MVFITLIWISGITCIVVLLLGLLKAWFTTTDKGEKVKNWIKNHIYNNDEKRD